MQAIKKLAGETVIYGISTIVPRFLNFILVPLYTHKIFLPGEYGVVTEFYAYIMVFMVILTYGMETGFFYFSEKYKNKIFVYSTGLFSLVGTSTFFLIIVLIFRQNIAGWLNYPMHPEYIVYIGVILALEAICSIPFASLRKQNKAVKFSVLKICNVVVILGLNIIFFVVFPKLDKNSLFVKSLYNPNIKIGYVFIANVIGSFVTFLLLLPEIFKAKFIFSFKLWRKMIYYSFPLLIAGLAGTINEAMDRIMLKHLLPDQTDQLRQLGIYGANLKIAVLLVMFTQMFRYAFEPFFFKQGKHADNKIIFAQVTKYFIIVSLIILIGILFYLDIIKFIIGVKYHEGLAVVPILLVANLFYGIFINLSVWYKLNNLTKFGAFFTLVGAAITIVINVLFVPAFGYTASAWARLICYVSMVVLSYYFSRKYYPIQYDLKRIGFYCMMTLSFIIIHVLLIKEINNLIIQYLFDTFLIFIFIFVIEKKEKLLFRLLKR